MVTIEQNPYKSIIILNEEEEKITIAEGDKIQFCLESGEIKRGVVTKLQGKNDKLKIQIVPSGKECEEIWSVLQMSDGSLKLQDEENKKDEEEEE